MSDQVLISLIGSFIALIGTMFTGYMAFKMAQLNTLSAAAAVAVKAAAVEVKEVKDSLQETTTATTHKLNEIVKTGEKNHILLNSNMGAALKLTAELSRWKADQMKGQDDGVAARTAEAAAKVAELNYQEHVGKQATVDAIPPT